MPDFQSDPVSYYGAKLLVGVMALGICCVLVHLARYRGRIAGRASWALLAAGIALLPLLSGSFGMVYVLERSTKSEFCGTCHKVMKTYLDDMTNPASGSLAAVHFKNRYIPSDQCYECHTAYGLRGMIQAKAQGITDVYRYYTHSFRVPITMRHPYRNEYCLKCHGGAVKFLAIKDHVKNQASLFSEKRTCMDCHGEAAPAHDLTTMQVSTVAPMR